MLSSGSAQFTGLADDVATNVSSTSLVPSIDALTQAMTTPAFTMSPLERFHKFPKFPLEIRTKIWRLAIPTRLLRPRTPSFWYLQEVMMPKDTPTVARACGEARHEFFSDKDKVRKGRITTAGTPEVFALSTSGGTFFTSPPQALPISTMFTAMSEML